MKIADSVIEQVKQQADILDVIGEYVRLKRAGGRFVGLCPFHEDKKTPSFSVSPDRGVYHCFGCKKSGNIFTFLKDYLGLSFAESVEYLAKKYNIELTRSVVSLEKDTKSDAAHKALKAAADYYHSLLFQKSGKAALEYFRKRDFSENTIKQFLLGYSPDSFDATSKHLFSQGFSEEQLIDAGLIVVREDGKKYDRFRGRAMFAIRDFIGRVVGFGARQMKDEENQPKYINSPQSIVYDKSKVLYGVFEAKNSIRNEKSAIIVEGYADLIALHQAGIANVVASSGTALTKQQLELLKRYTSMLFLVFDADQAGGKATDRAIELGLEEGFDIQIVTLPSGEDPDSIIKNHGRKVFDSRLQSSMGFLDYLSQKMLNAAPNSPAAKASIARNLLALISKVQDRLQHDFYIEKLSSLLDLSENQLRILYNEKSESEHKQSQNPYEYYNDAPPPDYVITDFEEAQVAPAESYEEYVEDDFRLDINEMLSEEKMLIQIAISLPKYFTMLIESGVSESTFISETGKLLYSIISDYSDELNIIQTLLEEPDMPAKISQALVTILMSDEKPSENWKVHDSSILDYDRKAMIDEILWRLKVKTLDMEIEEIKSRLTNKDDKQNDMLLLRQFELVNQKNELLSHRR